MFFLQKKNKIKIENFSSSSDEEYEKEELKY